MIYHNVLTVDLHSFIDWAEDNDVGYDVWNAEESISGADITELGLEEWPEVELSSESTFRIKNVDGGIERSELPPDIRDEMERILRRKGLIH